MLSCQAIGRPHEGQADAGWTTERRRGIRWMHTLRKEPTQAPTPTTRIHRTYAGMCATPARARATLDRRPAASAGQDQTAPIPHHAVLGVVDVVAVLGVARQHAEETRREELLEPAGRPPPPRAEAGHRLRQVRDVDAHLEIMDVAPGDAAHVIVRR